MTHASPLDGYVCPLWNTPLRSGRGCPILLRINDVVDDQCDGWVQCIQIHGYTWVSTKHLTCFTIFCLTLNKALKLYCFFKKRKKLRDSIKRLSALFMAVSVFLSVNSEYGRLWFQCQVVCYTIFIVCFQAVWPGSHRKYCGILRKPFGRDRRKKEAQIPPARHLQYIWVFWLLL